MSASDDDDGPFRGVVAGEEELRQAIAVLRAEIESLQRLEPLFLEGTAVLRLDIQSLRTQLTELPAATGGGGADLPGLRAEVRSAMREATEHLRTLVVEEVNELRGELQGVRSRLTDRRTQDRADLRTSLAAGSDTLRAALAEDAAALRAEVEAVRAQLKEQQVADQQLLRAELRAALREWNEHLRTRIVEEATELRSELHQVRGQLTDQQTQHRSDLKAAMSEGSGQVLSAFAEATEALRMEMAFLRDQLATREMVAGALAPQEQLRAALLGEIEWLRGDVRAMPAQLESQRTAAQIDIRAAVQEASQAAEAAFAQQAARLLTEIGTVFAQHEARRGDEGQQLRAMVTAATENLRAALLAETASARSSLIEQSERLRTEVQAVWTQLNDQHALERTELGQALTEGTDHVRGTLRREVEAIGTGLAAAQGAAQDELASLRGRVEAFSALFSRAEATARTDLGELRDQVQAVAAAVAAALEDSGTARMQLDALGMDLTASQATARQEAEALRVRLDEVAMILRAGLDEESAALRASFDAAVVEEVRTVVGEQSASTRDSLAVLADQVRAALAEESLSTRDSLAALVDLVRVAVGEESSSTRDSLVALADRLAAAVADQTDASRDSLRTQADQLQAALADEAASTHDSLLAHAEQVRAAVADEAASTRDALLERSDQLRAEVQTVWGQLNDQHGAERLQLEVTLRETSEMVRASLLVELTEFIQGQVEALGRTTAVALAEQVERLKAAVDDPERDAKRELLVQEVRVTAERLTGLQLELEAWRQQAAEERTGEVDALLAAVAGNEERLHQLVSTRLAEADRRRQEDRDDARAAFAAAAEERQAQLAYLEAALQTFNQALALSRQETQALVTWSQEATDASVGELAGRLDALGSMLSRIMAGEGVLEVSEAVAALRNDLARISRKLPAKAKAKAPGPEDSHTAKRVPRTTPAARSRRPSRPS